MRHRFQKSSCHVVHILLNSERLVPRMTVNFVQNWNCAELLMKKSFVCLTTKKIKFLTQMAKNRQGPNFGTFDDDDVV